MDYSTIFLERDNTTMHVLRPFLNSFINLYKNKQQSYYFDDDYD